MLLNIEPHDHDAFFLWPVNVPIVMNQLALDKTAATHQQSALQE